MPRFAASILLSLALASLPSCLTQALWENAADEIATTHTTRHEFPVRALELVDAKAGRPLELLIDAPAAAQRTDAWPRDSGSPNPLHLRSARGAAHFAAVACHGQPLRAFVDVELRNVDDAWVATATVELEGPTRTIGEVLDAAPLFRIRNAALPALPRIATEPQPWLRWMGIDTAGEVEYRNLGWLQHGKPSVDDSPVLDAFGDMTRPPDFEMLRTFSLCVAAHRDRAEPTYVSIRGDTLWFLENTTMRNVRGQSSWSHRTTWNCAVSSDDEAPGTDRTPAAVETAQLEIRVHEQESRAWRYAAATLLTPLTLVTDLAGGCVLTYFLLRTGEVDEALEDALAHDRRRRRVRGY